MNRVIFLVDGFNLYHSTKDIAKYCRGLRVKWLNIFALCKSYLYMTGRGAILKHTFYFTAYAYHLNDPGVIQRHKDYVRCLESTGIAPEFGRFKPKEINCPYCKKQITRHEEKETDVAIGAKLFEIFERNECDTVVIITGDTDLAPAIKTAKCLFPNKTILFAFPFRRKNDELAQIASKSFRIHKESYIRHQFPDPVILPDGTRINKPASW